MKFNWHELDSDGFLSWMVVHLLAIGKAKDMFEEFSDLTDKFNAVEMTIHINGIEVDVQHFVECIQEVMKLETQKAAGEIANGLIDGVREKMNEIEDNLEHVASDLREKAYVALYGAL